eukprot:GEZU01017909.1.p1 GENE.GEZU01017909.1~~GEZU01017909.1.p1  ORF type:complete len:131 (-),score=17.02 GEZU01017909.1:94-486(-)
MNSSMASSSHTTSLNAFASPSATRGASTADSIIDIGDLSMIDAINRSNNNNNDDSDNKRAPRLEFRLHPSYVASKGIDRNADLNLKLVPSEIVTSNGHVSSFHPYDLDLDLDRNFTNRTPKPKILLVDNQ